MTAATANAEATGSRRSWYRTRFYRRLDRLYAEPLRLTAAVAGWWFTSNLIIGLLISHDFATSPVTGENTHIWFVPVAVNGWHALAHGLTGLLGLLAATSSSWSVLYLGVFSLTYVGWGAAGLMTHGAFGPFFGDSFGQGVHVFEGTVLGLVLTLVAFREARSR